MNNKKISIYILCFLTFIILLFNGSCCFAINTTNADVALGAPTAILMDANTGKILYEKNAYEKMYPASTTKILTAILVLENSYLNEVVTVSESSLASVPASYTTAKLQAGEEIRVEDLLYAMLIPSGNDAANVLAEHVSGSISAFAELMNKKAAEIGTKNSHFTNPSGIHDANLYSTAYDLSLIARYAMNIDKFREIVKTENYTIPPTNLHPEANRTFSNSNLLLDSKDANYYYEYTTGVKTGFTDPSGDCLVASAKKDNIEFIAVCLKAGTLENGIRTKFLDCKALFDFGFSNYTTYYTELQAKNENNANVFESLFSDTLKNTETETSGNITSTSIFDFYRFAIKIAAILIVVLAIKLIFFRKKKNHRRHFSRKSNKH